MHNFAYGKDIRIFNLSNRIVDKFQCINIEQVKIQKDIKYKNLKVAIVEVFFLLIREEVVYGYLIYKVLYDNMSRGNLVMCSTTISGFVAWMQKILEGIAYINTQNLYINYYKNFFVTELKQKIPVM